jgi:hypothetical protein
MTEWQGVSRRHLLISGGLVVTAPLLGAARRAPSLARRPGGAGAWIIGVSVRQGLLSIRRLSASCSCVIARRRGARLSSPSMVVLVMSRLSGTGRLSHLSHGRPRAATQDEPNQAAGAA